MPEAKPAITVESLRESEREQKPAFDPTIPTIDNPPIPDPIDLLLSGKGRWRDADFVWREEVLAAYERKHGVTEIPEPQFEYDGEPPNYDPADAATRARLQTEGAAMLRRLESTRAEREQAQRREAAREILRKRGLLK